MGSCAETCGWCGTKGCVDEHPQCQEWARNGMCTDSPLFMVHTCRESCGVCGFLSPFNKEEQIVGVNSYSKFSASNFDCGRFAPLNITEAETTTEQPETTTTNEQPVEDEFDISDSFGLRSSNEAWVAPNVKEGGPNFCTATMIADRWAVSAAHCFKDLGQKYDDYGNKEIERVVIRGATSYKEEVEFKRAYTHPLYKSPELYNDVTLIELGRRVEYDYDTFGDTPACLDRGVYTKFGKNATVTGFGLNEKNKQTGKANQATNVTVIDVDECKKTLQANVTDNVVAQQVVDKHLPLGLSYGFICGQGHFVRENAFTGSCQGDSGGPLLQDNDNGEETLIGIVSGSIGCGGGIPTWYTKVEYYAEWIECIIENAALLTSKDKVQEACRSKASYPECKEAGLSSIFDLRITGLDSKELCEQYTGEIKARNNGK